MAAVDARRPQMPATNSIVTAKPHRERAVLGALVAAAATSTGCGGDVSSGGGEIDSSSVETG